MKSKSIPILGEGIPFSSSVDFSRSVKGRFAIAWAEPGGIMLCTDHHGMLKCFSATRGGTWWISNSLLSLVKILDAKVDPIGVAVFNLFEHFIGQRTLFENIRCSKPAAVFKLREKEITEDTHWHPLQWIDKPRIYADMLDWKDFWNKLLAGYLSESDSGNVLLTLTGGNDSRLVLAGLLALGIKPDSFTFGNPRSYDAVIAAEISKKIKSNHHCHFMEQPSSSWFRGCSEEIIRNGNGLVNIHRAHRLDAVKKEVALDPGRDILFTGFMGGDYLKGLSYDDYITAKFMRLRVKGAVHESEYLEDILREKYLQLATNQKEYLLDDLFPFLEFMNRSLPLPVQELLYLFAVIGSMHDYQDTTVFSWEIPNVISPNMDVDFLERLWASPYSSLGDGAGTKTKGSASRVTFSCRLTHLLAPELSHIPYAKWGGYSAWDLVHFPKTFSARRIFRHLLKKDRYVSSFSYGKWLYHFCKEELTGLHPEISSFYELKHLGRRLDEMPEMNTEREWHSATNPINLSMNYCYFKGKQ